MKRELGSLLGIPAKEKESHFRWRPAPGPVGAPHASSTFRSEAWRRIAGRVEQCADLLRTLPKDGEKVLATHLTKIRNQADGRRGGNDHARSVLIWTNAAIHNLTRGNLGAVSGLVRVARMKASKLEEENREHGLRRWRQSLGVQKPDDEHGSRAPTRAAYRWLRGTNGWLKSPMGSEAQNDDVLDDGTTRDHGGGLYDDLCEGEWITSPFKWTPNDATRGIGRRGDSTRRDKDDTGRHDADEQHDTPHNDPSSDCPVPLCAQADIDQEAAAWGKLWKELGDYNCSIDVSGSERPPPMEGHHLRRTALTFPAHTGVGVENISPRALARLSDECLDALAALLFSFEEHGEWGEEIKNVLIVLLAKADGGRRPIGLFPALIRIWMRARAEHAREWEDRHQRGYLYGGKGRGAQRAAWQNGFEAEASALDGQSFGQTLLDLVKAYEKIPHEHIVAAAAKLGFNMWVLRLSLASYRLSRAIGVDGVYSRLVVATCGITAGSVFATYELKVLLLGICDETYRLFPSIDLKLYVDDLTISCWGHKVEVLCTVANATRHIVRHMEDKLGLEVSKTKSVSNGHTFEMARLIAKISRTGKITAQRSVKMLGACGGNGRKRCAKFLTSRTGNTSTKVSRFRVLRRTGVRVKQMVRAACTPAIAYGVEVVGMSDGRLHASRVTTARALAPEGAGKNVDIVLMANDLQSGTIDPAFDAHALLIRTWATAWWEHWQPASRLRSTLNHAVEKLQNVESSKMWGKVAGPAAALVASMWRIGWDFISPSVVITDEGRRLDVESDPPAVFEKVAQQAVRRWRQQRICKALAGLGGDDVDGTDTPATRQLQTWTISFESAWARLLKHGATRSKVYDAWEPKFKPWLHSALNGGQWPQARLASTRKWTTENLCRLCGKCAGTIAHRQECEMLMPHGGWQQMPPHTFHVIHDLSKRRQTLLRTRGALVMKIRSPKPPEHEWFQWHKDPGDDIPENARWYIDGSLVHGKWEFARRTGFGVAIVDAAGKLIGFGAGAPPDWISDAAGAESWAFAKILQWTPFVPRVITDCLGILTAMGKGPSAARAASNPLARVWQMVFRAHDDSPFTREELRRVVWMPSHGSALTIGVSKRSDGRVVSPMDWRANRLVDALAKLAASSDMVDAGLVLKVERAARAVEHAVARLGHSTYAANHFPTTKTLDDGTVVATTVRDSLPGRRPTTTPPPTHNSGPSTATAAVQGFARVPPSTVTKRRLEELQEAELEAKFQQYRAENRPVLRPSSQPAATERLDALRQRVRERAHRP